MKNLKYIILFLLVLPYSSCTENDYETVESDLNRTKHKEFNDKYGFVDVDAASIPNSDSVLHFNTVEEADKYLSKYSSLSMHGNYVGQSYIEVIPINYGDEHGRSTNYPPIEYRIILKYKISRFTYYNVKFTHKISSTGTHTITNVSSGVGGFTIMSSWKHDGQSINRKPGSNHIVEMEVQAEQITNMFLEGIGKFDTRNIRMEVEYNTSSRTGKIKSVIDDKGPIKKYSPRPGDPVTNPSGTSGYGSGGSSGGSGGSYGGSGSFGSGGSGYSSGSGFTHGTSMGTRGTGYTGSASGPKPTRPSNPGGNDDDSPKGPCKTRGGGTVSTEPCTPPIV